MKAARIVVLGVAVVAGGLAALMAGRQAEVQPPPAPEPVAKLDTTEVLVAKSDIGLGQSVSASDVQWQIWPVAAAGPYFIQRNNKPNAIEEFSGSIARAPMVAGEPIREAKLIKANGSGFMAAILPSGMRAVSTEISPETGAGGFILPNDRVDVILTKREKNPERSTGDGVQSEIILANVRVLAIDQTVEEKNGVNTLVGRTVTLELKPEQAETLARARQSGTLALALRSIADIKMVENPDEQQSNKRGDSLSVIRYGVA